jgi:transposase
MALSHSRDRGEADRARALLLTLAGWTSSRIAEAFGVREDTVRLWRGAFSKGGVDALRRSVALGPAPVKAERALAVAEAVLSGSVADRPNWTLPRLADEIEKRSGVRISRSRLSVVLRQRGFPLATSAPYPEGPPGCTSRGSRWPTPQAPEGAGRGGRYRALVRG